VLYLSPVQFFSAKSCSLLPLRHTPAYSPARTLLVQFLFILCQLPLLQPDHRALSPFLPMDAPSPSRAHHGPTTDSEDATTAMTRGRSGRDDADAPPRRIVPRSCVPPRQLPGSRHRTRHIAVPLAAARSISPCLSATCAASLCFSRRLTLLVCFSFFLFSADFLFCGPITAVPHHSLCQWTRSPPLPPGPTTAQPPTATAMPWW
jgi:hypothetical protein